MKNSSVGNAFVFFVIASLICTGLFVCVNDDSPLEVDDSTSKASALDSANLEMLASTSTEVVQVDSEPDQESEDEVWVEGGILSALGSGSTPAYKELRVCNIVLAFDVQMRNMYPDHDNRSAAALAYVREKYSEQVGIWFEIAELVDIPADECTSWESFILRNQFRQFMIDNYYPKNWDCAHLFTGKELDGGWVSGISHYPGTGTERYLDEELLEDEDRGYTLSNYDGNDLRRSHSTFGHELGHGFNADHVYAHRTDNVFPIVNTCTWMWTPYRYDALEHRHDEFSVWNANRIRSWAQQTLDEAILINDGPTASDSNGIYTRNFRFYSDTFWMQPQSIKKISFQIHNTDSNPVTLAYLFVGGENAVGNQMMLGLQFDVTIAGNSLHVFTYDWYVTRAGTYDLWPAYMNSDYSRVDFVDLHVVPNCYYLESFMEGPIEHPTVSEDDMCMFYKWYLFSTSGIMNVDTTVSAYFTLFSCQPGGDASHDPGSAEDETIEFDDVFVACRTPNGVNRDFGSVGHTVLSYEAWSFNELDIDGLGGGCTIEFAESKKLDISGTWEFYPAWEYGDNYRLYEDWGIDLYISEPVVGGGCVAEGTLVTMADGSKKAVEDIRKGDLVLGYDIVNCAYTVERVLQRWSTWVSQVLNINDGALTVTLVDQPMYVTDSDGLARWVKDPSELQIGWMLFNGETESWMAIETLEVETERTRVFDFLTDNFQTYLGNSYLLMDKGKK